MVKMEYLLLENSPRSCFASEASYSKQPDDVESCRKVVEMHKCLPFSNFHSDLPKRSAIPSAFIDFFQRFA